MDFKKVGVELPTEKASKPSKKSAPGVQVNECDIAKLDLNPCEMRMIRAKEPPKDSGRINCHVWYNDCRGCLPRQLFKLVERRMKETEPGEELELIGWYDYHMGELSLETDLTARELLALVLEYLDGRPEGWNDELEEHIRSRMAELYAQYGKDEDDE